MSSLRADNIAPYIGLAQRANAVLYGEDIILERIKFAKVVLIDSDASDKYKERVYITANLKTALHKDGVNSVAVTNDNLANAIIEILR